MEGYVFLSGPAKLGGKHLVNFWGHGGMGGNGVGESFCTFRQDITTKATMALSSPFSTSVLESFLMIVQYEKVHSKLARELQG